MANLFAAFIFLGIVLSGKIVRNGDIETYLEPHTNLVPMGLKLNWNDRVVFVVTFPWTFAIVMYAVSTVTTIQFQLMDMMNDVVVGISVDMAPTYGFFPNG